MGNKGGDEQTIGYRYGFSILSGICRGPVDSVFLVRADGKVFYDLEIADNLEVDVFATELFGGDKGEGGLLGKLSFYFGKFDQVIPFGTLIRNIMAGLRVTQMRGVLTAFYDGEICANNPYPKAWQYRVRRALKGWKNDECWYPEKAVIKLSDASIQTTNSSHSTNLNSTASSMVLIDAFGNPTSDPTAAVTSVRTTYAGQSATSYTPGTGTISTYAVPAFYNDIYAMNPAHIIYECATNPDWGRGLPRELIDNASFASAANKLYSEGFGLCMKWSQQEDIDAFVQNVIDHIGAAVYTNPVTGLLCLRLIRNDYTVSALPVFDYEHGLLEVTSVSTAASDAIANEVIVKYHSPVLDADKEARAQNIASLNSLGSFFTVTKDYSGLPTADLALRAAARELKVNSGGWKRVEFKVDRRGYAIVPGDVLRITAPDRGISNLVLRIATVDQSEIKDGTITIVGTQDIYGWPQTALSVPQQGTFQEINRYPQVAQEVNLNVATYRDLKKFGINADEQASGRYGTTAGVSGFGSGSMYVTVMAQSPSSVSLGYTVYNNRSQVNLYPDTPPYDLAETHGFERRNFLNFQRKSVLSKPIGATDKTFEITGEILPSNAVIGGCYFLNAATNWSFWVTTAYPQEFVRLDAISQNPTTGVVTVTVARGCVDTFAQKHAAGARMWAYDESGGAINEAFGYYDNVQVKPLTRTISRGELDPNSFPPYYQYWTQGILVDDRSYRPYMGAGFRLNGYAYDQIPPQSGDLVCTWHHRDRIELAEHLIGEDEDDAGPEPGTIYGITVIPSKSGGPATDTNALNHYDLPFGLGGYHPFGGGSTRGTRSNTMTILRSDIVATGATTGKIRLIFQTARDLPNPYEQPGPGAYWHALYNIDFDIDYEVDPLVIDTDTSGGFNFDFDNNFDGGVA